MGHKGIDKITGSDTDASYYCHIKNFVAMPRWIYDIPYEKMQKMIGFLFSPDAHGAGMAKANANLRKEYGDIGIMTDQMVEDFRIWVQYPGEYDSDDDFVWTKPHYEVIDKVKFTGEFEFDLGSEEDSDSVMIPTLSGMPAVSFQPPETYSFGNNLHIFCRQG